jgi:hypothetical protein
MADDPKKQPMSDPEPEMETTTRARTVRLVLIIVGVVLMATVGGFLLLAPGDEFGKSKVERVEVWALTRPPAEKDAPYYQGYVARDADSESMPILLDNGKRVELSIREEDRAYIDWQHAQSHADLGQPIRAYWRKDGDRKAVIFIMDAPLPGQF